MKASGYLTKKKVYWHQRPKKGVPKNPVLDGQSKMTGFSKS